jgi:hypothetical protein
LNDNSSDFLHAVGSGAGCCFTDFEASGSGAAASSYHTRLNSEMFVASQRNSDSEMLDDHTKDVDRKSLDLIEDILTSIEMMSKSSLSDLANSHGVKFNTKMSSNDFKNVLSDHICNGFCFSSTFKGCMQLTSTLSS